MDRNKIAKILDAFHLDLSEKKIYYTLSAEGGLSIKELHEVSGMSESYIEGAVKSICSKGVLYKHIKDNLERYQTLSPESLENQVIESASLRAEQEKTEVENNNWEE